MAWPTENLIDLTFLTTGSPEPHQCTSNPDALVAAGDTLRVLPPELPTGFTPQTVRFGGREGATTPDGRIPVRPGDTVTFSVTIEVLDAIWDTEVRVWAGFPTDQSANTVIVEPNSIVTVTHTVVAPPTQTTAQPSIRFTNVQEGGEPRGTVVMSDIFFGRKTVVGGVAEAGVATADRLGIVSDVTLSSRDRIPVELSAIEPAMSGDRIELAAAAHGGRELIWRWEQILGPEATLEVNGNTCDLIAPDVGTTSILRIAVMVSSPDGVNRSDWHYFNVPVSPPLSRMRGEGEAVASPILPRVYGYERGKREVWNDVVPPRHMREAQRHEVKALDLGVPVGDTQAGPLFPPESAPAGGVFIDTETWDIYRNFGPGYNNSNDSSLAAPRQGSLWVNPSTGDVFIRENEVPDNAG